MKSLKQFILESSNKNLVNGELLYDLFKNLPEIKKGKKISELKDGDKVNIIGLDYNHNIRVFRDIENDHPSRNSYLWCKYPYLTSGYDNDYKGRVPKEDIFLISSDGNFPIPDEINKIFINSNIFITYAWTGSIAICLADDTNIELVKSILNDNKEKLIVTRKNSNSNSNSNFDILWDNFFGGLEISSSEEKQLKKIITKFTKDAKSLKIEASEEGKSYWEGMGVEDNLIKQNNDVEDEVEDLPGNAEWEVEEMFALTTDGDTLLVRCNWDDDPNGEYFDLKVTKVK